MKTINLIEYKPLYIPRDEIPKDIINQLKQQYQTQFKITLEDTTKGDQWKLISQGWVGYIPLTSDWSIHITPKVPITNLLGMLEYAYNLKSFRFLDGLMNCESLPEFYNSLATIFAHLVLNSTRKGLYQTYLKRTQELNYIRGRLDIKTMLKHPWKPKLNCHYDEHSKDIEDNQILLWTIYIISRQEICNENTRILIRKTYHALQGYITLSPFTTKDCIDRKYNRLNEDYKTLHSLCRFFLEETAPSHKQGEYQSLPFLVNMNQLYEKFVAAWLKVHLPQHLGIKCQHQVNIKQNNDNLDPVQFKIDLIIYETLNHKNIYILDTKYKLSWEQNDLNQIVTYATAKQCRQAILIYPSSPHKSLDLVVNNIHVRSLIFSLDSDLEKAGKTFLQQLQPSLLEKNTPTHRENIV